MPPVTEKAPQRAAKKPTGWFRIKLGIAVVPDLNAEYDPTPNPTTGAVPKRPSKVVKAGDGSATFESEADMVAKHGAEKFERIAAPRVGRDGRVEAGSPLAYDADGNPLTADFGPGHVTGDAIEHTVAVAPHGQVSTGFQQTGGGFPPGQPAGALPVPAEQLDETDGGRDRYLDPQLQGDDEPDYGQMTVAQLDQHAADNEIDLSRAHNKADKIKAIRKAAKATKGK